MPVQEVASEQKEETLETLFKKAKDLQISTKLKILVWGPQGLGKSYFGLSCPEPVWVICTEPDSVTPLLVHFEGKEINILECSIPYTDAPTTKRTGKQDESIGATDPEQSLRMFEKATELLKDIDKGTIVIDSVSDVWEWFTAWIEYNADRYTQSGQMMRTEWGKVNSKYKNLLNRLMSRPVHFVMTARAENVYGEGGRETTQKKMSGQKRTPYIPHVIMQIKQEPKSNIDTKTGKIMSTSVQTVGVIEKARGFDNSALGVKVVEPTFDKLKEALKGKGGEGMFT